MTDRAQNRRMEISYTVETSRAAGSPPLSSQPWRSADPRTPPFRARLPSGVSNDHESIRPQTREWYLRDELEEEALFRRWRS